MYAVRGGTGNKWDLVEGLVPHQSGWTGHRVGGLGVVWTWAC